MLNPKIESRRQLPRTTSANLPVVSYAAHDRGQMVLAIANNGTFGTYGENIIDPFTGQTISSCLYPRNSDLVYLWVGAFWIGAVIGRDTLVSVGTDDFYGTEEFWPEPEPFGKIAIESIDPNSTYYSPRARSEQDIIVSYTDTFTDPALVARDNTDDRNHIPLNISVRQRTMAWSYSYADDFILFDYAIENVGTDRITDAYMGIWVDGDVWHVTRNSPEGWNDDIVGFLYSVPSPDGCERIDTVRIAYHADNDGDPLGSSWDSRSVPHAVGTRIVRTPAESLSYSFNWWIINYGDPARDFGPRRIGNDSDPFRSFGDRLGTPEGDRNKYYTLKHPEFDYDLLFTAVDHVNEGFLPPPQFANLYARGYDTRYLLSFGPFDVDPGQVLPITFAWVGGRQFHTDPSNFKNLFSPSSPKTFYQTLNFDTLAINSRWASWVYDNPGVDTDDDGYAGKFFIQCQASSPAPRSPEGTATAIPGDTIYYEGDGVPDFRGASPPPAPFMKVTPTVGSLTIRWNGYQSENTPDVFLREIDFEGYRIYTSLDDRPSSFSLLASYDREDYTRHIWVQNSQFTGWLVRDIPFTLDSLRHWRGDPDFSPQRHSKDNPLYFKDSIFYFSPQDYNAHDFGSLHGIRRAYPEAQRPSKDSTEWIPSELTFEHGIPLPKYYEYEFTLRDIQPTVPLYVAVTAFDFGSPRVGIASLETDPLNNYVIEYPLASSDSVVRNGLDAYVYPNPYRFDGNYEQLGYENRDGSLAVDRARRIHFANLPSVCTISIYSLDGDLVASFRHNFSDGSPQSSHDTWDLITRNTQAPVSGLYYWVIESPNRTQIGKLVLIE